MENRKIHLQDLSFYGDLSSSKYHDSSKIEWDRTGGPCGSPVFFTDSCLSMAKMPQYKDIYKIAWLIEPAAIRSDTYKYIENNRDIFDLVLSHDKNFVSRVGKNAEYYPNCMSWIGEEHWEIYPKTKNISMIVSEKRWTTGHRLRYELIESYKTLPFDVYGPNFGGFIKDKIDILKDYRFHVVIENCRCDAYFTEKLIDCFATGTVPIYWGCPSIEKFFNTRGMIIPDNIGVATVDSFKEDLELILDEWDSKTNYEDRLPAIKENFEIAKKYKVAEDWIFDNILIPKGLV